MSIADNVRAAASPQAAILALAEGIDLLLTRETAQADAWASWSPLSPDGVYRAGAQATPSRPQPDVAAKLRKLEQDLLIATGEDVRAIEAQIGILKDDGAALPPPVSEGVRLDVDGDLVGFPPASPERKQRRLEWATPRAVYTYQAAGNVLTEQEMIDAFVKGGPMWLYLYDRDAIMGMPMEWRTFLVQDVEEDSPAEAQELARDILKDQTNDGGRESFAGAVID